MLCTCIILINNIILLEVRDFANKFVIMFEIVQCIKEMHRNEFRSMVLLVSQIILRNMQKVWNDI